MNKKLQELFDGLNHLCETNDAFYNSEQDYGDNYTIRSYTYRLATWSDFQLPYALDCRGTAFVLDKRTSEWSLFARGYRKFFNLGEFGVFSIDYIPEEKYKNIDYKDALRILKLHNRKYNTYQELLDSLADHPK